MAPRPPNGIIEFPPEVETSSDASFQLAHVELNLPFKILSPKQQIFACRLFVGSRHEFDSCMQPFEYELHSNRNWLVEKIGSIVLHLTSFDEVRQSIP